MEAARYIASQTGLETEAITPMFVVKRASPSNLEWSLDTSAAVPPSGDWSRPWAKTTAPVFEASTLVKVLTREDKFVCHICATAAENSPYTYEEAMKMFSHGFPGELGLHPRCRCLLGAWSSTRRIDVSFGGSSEAPFESKSLKTIGLEVVKQYAAVLKAV